MKCAQAILSSYRRDDFANPDGYLVQLGMVLERYDDKVIEAVTSPLGGIQRSCKFPPSISEVVEFTEEYIRRNNYGADWDRRAAKQLQDQAEREAFDAREPLEQRKAVAARILAEYKSHLTPETKPQRSTWQRFSAEALLAKYPPKAKEQGAQ